MVIRNLARVSAGGVIRLYSRTREPLSTLQSAGLKPFVGTVWRSAVFSPIPVLASRAGTLPLRQRPLRIFEPGSIIMKLSDLTVMLVEPSKFQFKVVQRLLKLLGITDVQEEHTGASALVSIRESKPDLVISALYLPDMTGTDLVHAMRSDPEVDEIAFMLISSETCFRVLEPIRQAGALAILPKPFTKDELSIALHSTLDYVDQHELQLQDYDPEEIEVLLVDDSEFSRKHMRRVLKGMGFERFTDARDGVEAMELLNGRFFDLVVTDYNMPNMDGKELVDYIRSGSSQSAVPVIMVTSEHDVQRLAAVQQSGVSAICDKPFETDSVRQLLRQLLSR